MGKRMRRVRFRETPKKVIRVVTVSFVTPEGKRVKFTRTKKVRKPIGVRHFVLDQSDP